MPPKKKSSKGRSTSRKTEQPAGQPKPLIQAQTQSAFGRGQHSKPASKQEKSKNIQTTELPQPKKHTRRTKGSPLWERREDIDKLTGKGKQEPKRSSLAVKSATQLDPAVERQQKHQQPDTLPHYLQPVPSIEQALEAAPTGERERLDLQCEETFSTCDSTDSEITPWLRDLPDTEEVFLQRSGYIVPLSNEALAAIQVVLGKEAALKMAGIRSDSHEFGETLNDDRNILSEETTWTDPERLHLDTYDFRQEANTASIADFLDELWRQDLGFCKNQQEAIFQRTVMMAMIDRHRLIFSGNERLTELPKSVFMFSVDAMWNCPPMPTRKYEMKADMSKVEPKTFTTLPKPDLCVSFRTGEIISSALWKILPPETKHLICYEGIDTNNKSRAFGFLFVEAKRSRLQPDDDVALHQALNDASQALHNIYEFFKEAGSTSTFFERVRVFSATTSEKGVILRIHWAVELSTERILPTYPLQFEYQVYESFQGKSFNRLKVVEAFERIIKGYGENQLLKLLQKAAKSVEKKAEDAWGNKDNALLRTSFCDHRYGQSGQPGRGSKRPTPTVSSNQLASSVIIGPPNLPRNTRESRTSDTTELIDKAEGQSTLRQGIAGHSQGSKGYQKQGQGTASEMHHDNPNKKQKT